MEDIRASGDVMEADFTKIYDRNYWGGGSGTGSRPKYCEMYLAYIKSLLRPGMVVLDLGCGDWQMYEGFDWSGVEYFGVDIVRSVVQANIEKHRTENIYFMHSDFSQPIEIMSLCNVYTPDLILMKDVIHHWTDEEIQRFVEALKICNFGTMILTTDYKYFRSPWKNGMPRDLNNKYRWAPVDMTQYGFEHVMYFPRGKYKQVLRKFGRQE